MRLKLMLGAADPLSPDGSSVVILDEVVNFSSESITEGVSPETMAFLGADVVANVQRAERRAGWLFRIGVRMYRAELDFGRYVYGVPTELDAGGMSGPARLFDTSEWEYDPRSFGVKGTHVVTDEQVQDDPDACWCGATATVINEATDASPEHPACAEHVKDGYRPVSS